MSTKLLAEKTNIKSTSSAAASKSDSSMKSAAVNPDTSTQNDPKIQDKCIAEGCQKLAVADSEWDNEYCSINCCYDHCKFTFNAWLEGNKKTKAKTNTVSSTQEHVASTSTQQPEAVNQ